MTLLLDTHIGLWLAQGGRELSAGERAAVEDRAARLVFSVVSLWELRLKWNSVHRSGERKGPASPASVRHALIDLGGVELGLSGEDALADLVTPLAHKDPFDELLLAQAQQHGLRLLTRDRKLIGHPLALNA